MATWRLTVTRGVCGGLVPDRSEYTLRRDGEPVYGFTGLYRAEMLAELRECGRVLEDGVAAHFIDEIEREETGE